MMAEPNGSPYHHKQEIAIFTLPLDHDGNGEDFPQASAVVIQSLRHYQGQAHESLWASATVALYLCQTPKKGLNVLVDMMSSSQNCKR